MVELSSRVENCWFWWKNGKTKIWFFRKWWYILY